MNIYIANRTDGGGGSGPRGNLACFDNIISKALLNAGFTSLFEEFWLTLVYPAINTSSWEFGGEDDFQHYYGKLPILLVSKRYKKIDIALKAPEFSHHFNQNTQHWDEQNPYIEANHQDLSETELATTLIDKFINAGEIVDSKIKKDDIFDFKLFKETLIQLQQQITDDFLQAENTKVLSEIHINSLKRAVDLREQRKVTNTIKNKRIRDLRVYYADLPKKALYPYDFIYTEIFLNLLKNKNLLCPVYNHLYIQVGTHLEKCLINSVAPESWYVNGLSLIDYDVYLKANDAQKEQIAFNVIINGLRDIATIDKLDDKIITETIEIIKQKGIDTELEYLTLENAKYKLLISYLSRSMEEQCPIYLEITDKKTNKTKKTQIGLADNFEIEHLLRKVTMSNTLIKIKSSDSIVADV